MREHGRPVLSKVCMVAGPEKATLSVDELAVRTTKLDGHLAEYMDSKGSRCKVQPESSKADTQCQPGGAVGKCWAWSAGVGMETGLAW
jgi:hypothetical protein